MAVLLMRDLRAVCLVTQSCSTLWWTVAHQAPLSMGFSRQEYWSGLLFTPPGDLPDLGIELRSPVSPALQGDSLPLSHEGSAERFGILRKELSIHSFTHPSCKELLILQRMVKNDKVLL